MDHRKIVKDYEDGGGQQYWTPQMGTCSVRSGSCFLIGQKYLILRVGAGTLVTRDTVGLGY